MDKAKEVLKTCRLCGQTKLQDLFEKDKRYKDGYSTRCQSCKNQLNKVGFKAFYRFKERFPGQKVETSKEEVQQIFDVFEGRCAYCNRSQEEGESLTMTLEHIIPPSRGGRHHVSNLVIACKPCNSKKHDLPIGVFYKRLPIEWRRTDEFILWYVAYFSGMTIEETREYFKSDYKKWEESQNERMVN